MRKNKQIHRVSDTTLEIARKLHPPRYKIYKNLRPLEEAAAWAQKLDWRENPYDRFLLRQEILKHLETRSIHEPGFRNVYTYASRQEIAAEVDRLIEKFPKKFEKWGVFGYVVTTLPWYLGAKHGRVRRDPLVAALNATEAKQDTKRSRRRTTGLSR
jgi:hypothetical protein